jgi:hypothetical protein
MLLDVALSNGRRGEQTVFWCVNAEEATRVYRVAADLLYQGRDFDVEVDPKNLTLRWPQARDGRGSVVFAFEDRRNRMRGYRATVVVMDEARWNDPEPCHAHTVVRGG